MLNYLKNRITKYTKLLIRIDDVAENMNWNYMDKCEKLFDENEIKPLLGVIPINKDEDLLRFPKNGNFWARVNEWQNKGWEITMHGCNHLYTQKSDKNDIFNYGGNSEFYGLNYHTQLEKIKTAALRKAMEEVNLKCRFQNIVSVEDEELKGSLKMQNVVGNFSRTPGKIKHAGPKLGEHNKEILVDMLGFDQEQLIKAGYSLSSPELEENHD